MRSPVFRVRDYDVVDAYPFPITLTWKSESGEPKSQVWGREGSSVCFSTCGFTRLS